MDDASHQCEFIHETILFELLVTFFASKRFLPSKFVHWRRFPNTKTFCHMLGMNEVHYSAAERRSAGAEGDSLSRDPLSLRLFPSGQAMHHLAPAQSKVIFEENDP